MPGGLSGYGSDDINKFLWMVRIGSSIDPTIDEAEVTAALVL